MVGGGLYSSSHCCLLPFTNGFEGSFMFRGFQNHGTTMLFLKVPTKLRCLRDSGNMELAYRKPDEKDHVYFPAIYRAEFGLEDPDKYSTKTWGW